MVNIATLALPLYHILILLKQDFIKCFNPPEGSVGLKVTATVSIEMFNQEHDCPLVNKYFIKFIIWGKLLLIFNLNLTGYNAMFFRLQNE